MIQMLNVSGHTNDDHVKCQNILSSTVNVQMCLTMILTMILISLYQHKVLIFLVPLNSNNCNLCAKNMTAGRW